MSADAGAAAAQGGGGDIKILCRGAACHNPERNFCEDFMLMFTDTVLSPFHYVCASETDTGNLQLNLTLETICWYKL